jgi:uncharacterized protein
VASVPGITSRTTLLTALFVAAGAGAARAQESAPAPRLQEARAVPFTSVRIEDAFWTPRLERNRTVTLAANLRQCEATGRIRNFAVAAGVAAGKHEGYLFDDSDVYKVIEGAAYALTLARDDAVEKRIDAIVDLIAAAQQKDGYLNTYYTLAKPEERWRNTAHGHEMYCAGHLIEAGVAYAQATGKGRLLEVATRFGAHIDSVFGPEKRHDVCGHPEIELALVKLWRHTPEPRWLALARYFVDQRGRADGRVLFGEHSQDHRPVREQTEVVGHAVRAMYLYCAMADLAAIGGDASLFRPLEVVWDDVTGRKMYVTGGIGSSASNEGFTKPWDLPNETAYCETCASIGLALWGQRMYLATGEGRYADVVERALYNNVLAGVSKSGDRFFYVNPLASKGAHHREAWFRCACCPPNILRFLASLGERIYAVRGDELDVTQYIGGSASVRLDCGVVEIVQETTDPRDGGVTIAFRAVPDAEWTLRLRLPEWASAARVSLGGEPLALERERGFVRIRRRWKTTDRVELRLPSAPRRVFSDPRVEANVGRVAVMQGPLVLCLEGVDQDGSDRKVSRIVLPRGEARTSTAVGRGGVRVTEWSGALRVEGSRSAPAPKPATARFVPYCDWDNRDPGEMAVWIPEREDLVDLPP